MSKKDTEAAPAAIHDPFGGSKWPAFSVSPAFRGADGTSKEAQSGTRAHIAMAVFTGNSGATREEVQAEIKKVKDVARTKLTDEEIEIARWAVGVKQHYAQGRELHPETPTKIDAPELANIHGIEGTADDWCLGAEGEPPIIFDLKSGAREFPERKFEQFVCYAAGLMSTAPEFAEAAAASDYKVRFIALLGGARSAVETTVDINAAAERANTYIGVAKAATPETCTPNPSSCEYCKFAADCPARKNDADAAARESGIIQAGGEYVPMAKLDTPNALLRLKGVAAFFDAAKKQIQADRLDGIMSSEDWKKHAAALKELAATANFDGAGGVAVKFIVKISTEVRIG